MGLRTNSARWVAASLAVVLVGWTGTPAGAPAIVTGTVFAETDRLPLAGATIHVIDIASGELISSARTAADGNFEVRLPVGVTYEVGVEHDGGLFVVAEPVTPRADEPLVLNLAIRKSPEAADGIRKTRRGAGGLLASPLAATLLVAGAAITAGAIIESSTGDDPDPPASEFLTR